MTVSSASRIADMAANPSMYVVTLQLLSHGTLAGAASRARLAISVPSAHGLPSPVCTPTLAEVNWRNHRCWGVRGTAISAPFQQVEPQATRALAAARAPGPAGPEVRRAVRPPPVPVAAVHPQPFRWCVR